MGDVSEPSEKAGNGERDERGRFLPGWSGGPGRPRRPDLYHQATEVAAAENIDVGKALGRVALKVLKEAEAGDMHAAKIAFDYLAEKVADKVEHSGDLTLRQLLREAAGADGDAT